MEIVIDEKNLQILRVMNLQIEVSKKNFTLVCETLLRMLAKDNKKFTVNLEKGIFEEVNENEENTFSLDDTPSTPGV